MRVFGISTDDVQKQAAFHKDQKLNFALLSDPDASVAKKFGVLHGRGFARRVTFVIDDAGVLRHIAPKVGVRTHGDDLAKLIGALREK